MATVQTSLTMQMGNSILLEPLLATEVPQSGPVPNGVSHFTALPKQQDIDSPTKVRSQAPAAAKAWQPPPTILASICHPHAEEVAHEVDTYFLANWPFPDPKAKKTFLNAGFSRVTCLYFPLSKDDRISCACRLLSVLFLIDDLLENKSLADGKAFNETLFPIMRGQVEPDRSVASQFILYDLFQDMRLIDKELADGVLEPTFIFMRAQTDSVRLNMKSIGDYLLYREKDVGKALLSALMRFCLDLHLSPAELESMVELEIYCARHISVVNDIMSWEKELKAAQSGHREGSVLCTAVKVMADETCLSVPAAKRVLWHMVREWEKAFRGLCAERLAAPEDCGHSVRDYIRGLEHQMSGNEVWSLKDILTALAEAVKAHEPGCLIYTVYEQPQQSGGVGGDVGGDDGTNTAGTTGTPSIILHEKENNRYVDHAALDSHLHSSHFAKLAQALATEDLLRVQPRLEDVRVTKLAGHSRG
ncbi:MAG: hypothetical protein M1816_007290 [Peltula sp. TS41687]|nr:MAG: hypothetical protein M1816_007290 [Peltula sp. TS41687]